MVSFHTASGARELSAIALLFGGHSIVELLESFELNQHAFARRGRPMPLPFGLSALAEDLCKARFGSLLFIRIVRGGGDELPDHPSRTHEPIVVDTAAMGIAQYGSSWPPRPAL